MKSLKLTTGPGNPCSGVGMEANGQTAIAEMRSPLEATNGLALDGLTVFNHVRFPVSLRVQVMHVNRPDNYTGPDTPPPKLDPNLLLQICTFLSFLSFTRSRFRICTVLQRGLCILAGQLFMTAAPVPTSHHP